MEDVDDPQLARLTAEMAWLRRLARALVNADDADDLAHDTYVVAADRAPDDRPLRPWLARVALNLSRMQRRARLRREARELAVEAPGAVGAPDELVARVELQQQIASEVLKLAEPYRTTVLLHYFEELPCAEIARRLDVPEATVRGRLKVALDRLRARLDGGRGRSGLAVLAPLAGVSTPNVGVIAMKKLIALFALLMIVVAAALWWNTASHSDAPSSHPGGRAVRVTAASSRGVAVPPWVAQAGVTARRVAGRVESAGAPVPGAIVRLALDLGDGVLVPIAEARADGAGAFDFGSQPAATFTVSAETPEHPATAITVALADPRIKPDDIVLHLDPCTLQLYGAVLDASGGPIVKARLRSAGLGGAQSDAQGRYTLCLGVRRPWVRVDADGYGAVESTLIVGGSLHYDFVLVPEASLAGRVVMADGTAVAGARVIVRPDPIERPQHLASGSAFADADGRFRILGLAPGRYRATASGDGVASRAPIEVIAHAGATAAVDVVVERAARVRGRVLLAGAPVAGARVAATRNGDPTGAPSISQVDGSFVLDGVPFGTASFVAAPYEVKSPRTVEITSDIDVTLDVGALAAIRGVITRRGAPTANAEVIVPQLGIRTQADVHGAYVLDGLPAGEITFFAGHSATKAFANRVVTLAAGEDKRVDIELDHAGEVIGVVVDEGGHPMPGVYVRLASSDNADIGESMTDASGRFDCSTLAGGEYVPRVYPSAMTGRPFATASGEPAATIEVPQDGVVRGIELAIHNERADIHGSVVDDTGAPVADAHVELVGRGRAWVNLPAGMTDASGRFAISNLVPGVYALHARTADGSEATVTDVQAGRDDVTIALTRPGAIAGRLVGFGGSPTVELATLATSMRVATRALVDGDRFVQRGLPPGRYGVQARAGGEVDSVEVEVRSGETAQVTLERRRVGAIEGTVTDFDTKAPVAGVRCEAKLSLAGPTTDPAMQAITDAAGHFAMRAPIGTVHVLCSPADLALTIGGVDVEVVDQGTATVAVTTVRTKLGATRGDAGFSLKPLVLPLSLVHVGNGAVAAGLRDGDHLMTIDGASVAGMLPLTAMTVVWNHRPGTTITLGVERGGTVLTFAVPVVAAPR